MQKLMVGCGLGCSCLMPGTGSHHSVSSGSKKNRGLEYSWGLASGESPEGRATVLSGLCLQEAWQRRPLSGKEDTAMMGVPTQ
jgi:hypothetical protein